MNKAARRRRKRLVWTRSFGTCQWCWQAVSLEEASLDHIVPRSKGGTNDISNLQIMHPECNSRKGSSEMPILTQGKPRPESRRADELVPVVSKCADPLAVGGVFAEWKIRLGL